MTKPTKVYIVTSGSYSDYGIRKVFLDEDKAEKYAKAHSDNDAGVEEWDVSDDVVETMRVALIAHISYTIDRAAAYREPVDFGVYFTRHNSIDDDMRGVKDDITYQESDFGGKTVYIERVVATDETVDLNDEVLQRELEEKYESKYRKFSEDLMAQIQSLRQNEGWTEEMVNEWLPKREASE